MSSSSETVQFINLPFLKGVEAVIGRNVTNDFRRHIHKTFIIGHVVAGGRIVTQHTTSAIITARQIFIINPGQAHTCRSQTDNGHSYNLLSIAGSKMKSISAQISEKTEAEPFFPQVICQHSKILEAFNHLFVLLKGGTPQLELECEVNTLLADLILRFSEPPPPICQVGEQNHSLERVCSHIKKHYQKNLSLEQLATVACLSPFHLQRIFVKKFGISPHEYQMHYRISEAKKILLNSQDIADTAVTIGFSDQSHFANRFRKIVGIPPGKYIKQNALTNRST